MPQEYRIPPARYDCRDYLVPGYELAMLRPLVPNLCSLTVRFVPDKRMKIIREILHHDGRWWGLEVKNNCCGPFLSEELAVEFDGVEVKFEHPGITTSEDEDEDEEDEWQLEFEEEE